MNRGFSLLEFLVASSLFMAVILGGYWFLDEELRLNKRILHWTRPEAELNYRMLVVQMSLEDATRSLAADPLLSRAPAVFPDLQFGEDPEEQAFTVACPIGAASRFVRDGDAWRAPASSNLTSGTVVLLAGPSGDETYGWDYRLLERVSVSGAELLLEGSSLPGHSLPDVGSEIPVQLQGLAFRDGVLYWVQPSGEFSPFANLDDFRCLQTQQLLQIDWRIGALRSAFRVRP